jgi:hypothetical protein
MWAQVPKPPESGTTPPVDGTPSPQAGQLPSTPIAQPVKK